MKKISIMAAGLLLAVSATSCGSKADEFIDVVEEATEKVENANSISEVNKIDWETKAALLAKMQSLSKEEMKDFSESDGEAMEEAQDKLKDAIKKRKKELKEQELREQESKE